MPQRDNQQHTYADYLIWSADYGDELVDGVAYVREPPGPTRLHQEIAFELSRQIANALDGKPERVYLAPLDVRLPKNGTADDQIDTVVQPDVFIVSDLRKLDARGVCGAPDWLAEVLSPSNTRHDKVTKLAAYERAGVPEVWLIHPIDRTVTIHRLEAGRYARPITLDLKGRTTIAAVAGITIDWDRFAHFMPRQDY
jgi:Uma2 family endonuclease